jgi:hypothetical protein
MVGIVCGGAHASACPHPVVAMVLPVGSPHFQQVSASAQDDSDGVDKLSALRTKAF